MTDEPALQHKHSPESIIQDFLRTGCLAFVYSVRVDYFVRLGEVTGGSWFDISSTTSLDDIANALQKLAQAVTRIVDKVIRLSGGNVKEYRALKSG